MRIVHILPKLDASYLSEGVLGMACEMLKGGHQVLVISAGGPLVSRLTVRGGHHETVAIEKSGLGSAGSIVRQLRKAFMDFSPQVIHAHSANAALSTLRTLRDMPSDFVVPVVFSYSTPEKLGLFAGAKIKALRTVNQLTVESRFLATQLPAPLAAEQGDALKIMPRGVNTREFDADTAVAGHWQQRILTQFPQLEERNWLHIPGPVAPGAGHDQFLEMLAQLVRERDDVFGLITGAVEPRWEKHARRLEQRAVELDLGDKVLFLGGRQDMREFFACSRITYHLLESPQTAVPDVAAALAMRCPVIGYKGGAQEELLEACFPQGLVSARGNVADLVERSLEVLSYPEPVKFAGLSLRETVSSTLHMYQTLGAGVD